MKIDWTVLVAIAVLVFTINGNVVEPTAQNTDYRSVVATSLAGAILNEDTVTPVTPVKKYKRSECPECRGTGMITHGDGHKTECQSCEPDGPRPKPRPPLPSEEPEDETTNIDSVNVDNSKLTENTKEGTIEIMSPTTESSLLDRMANNLAKGEIQKETPKLVTEIKSYGDFPFDEEKRESEPTPIAKTSDKDEEKEEKITTSDDSPIIRHEETTRRVGNVTETYGYYDQYRPEASLDMKDRYGNTYPLYNYYQNQYGQTYPQYNYQYQVNPYGNYNNGYGLYNSYSPYSFTNDPVGNAKDLLRESVRQYNNKNYAAATDLVARAQSMVLYAAGNPRIEVDTAVNTMKARLRDKGYTVPFYRPLQLNSRINDGSTQTQFRTSTVVPQFQSNIISSNNTCTTCNQ